MILRCLLAIGLIALSNAQFGGLGKAAKNPIGSAAKVAETGAQQAQAFATEWLSFKKDFNKVYSPAEEIQKNANFIKNLDFITKFAQSFADGVTSFGCKINQFADLVNDEFNKFVNGFRPGGHKLSWNPLPFQKNATQLPKSVNWVQKGAVSPVKNQGLCQSCHAFAACAAVEGHNYIKTGKLVELSPQNILDCTKEGYQSYGCAGGGYVDEDYKYIRDKGGANLLTSYPYEAKDGTCRFDNMKTDSEIKGYVVLPEGDEEALEAAVAQYGPVAAGIDASRETFQFYSDGIYDDKDCKNGANDINHAVLVVGYGEENGKKYWLVKNSYSEKWGEQGYIKIAKNNNNRCGIATICTYPVS